MYLNQLGLTQAEAGSQTLHPGLPLGREGEQEPKYWHWHLLPPGCALTGSWSQDWSQTQVWEAGLALMTQLLCQTPALRLSFADTKACDQGHNGCTDSS